MPSTNLFPRAVGAHNTWADGAGTQPTNVQTNDGDATYRNKAGGTTGADGYLLDLMPAASQITSVTGSMIVRRDAAGGGTTACYTYYTGTLNGAGRAIDINYTLYSDVYATAGGGAAWTEAIVNASSFGVNKTVAGAAGTRCTQIYATVVYVPPAGGYAMLVFQWLTGLSLGGNITMDVLKEVLHAVRHKVVLTRDEVLLAFREIQEAKHAKHFV